MNENGNKSFGYRQRNARPRRERKRDREKRDGRGKPLRGKHGTRQNGTLRIDHMRDIWHFHVKESERAKDEFLQRYTPPCHVSGVAIRRLVLTLHYQ